MTYENVNLGSMHPETMKSLLKLINPTKTTLDRTNKMIREFDTCDQTYISSQSHLLFAAQILNTAWNCCINNPVFDSFELQKDVKDKIRDMFICQVNQILEIVTEKENK